MKWLWLALAALFAVAAGATWFAFQRPDFVAGLVTAAVTALGAHLWPYLAKALKPRPLTRDEIQINREGGEWQSKRPFGRQKGE